MQTVPILEISPLLSKIFNTTFVLECARRNLEGRPDLTSDIPGAKNLKPTLEIFVRINVCNSSRIHKRIRWTRNCSIYETE
jgi:hypothetical protein